MFESKYTRCRSKHKANLVKMNVAGSLCLIVTLLDFGVLKVNCPRSNPDSCQRGEQAGIERPGTNRRNPSVVLQWNQIKDQCPCHFLPIADDFDSLPAAFNSDPVTNSPITALIAFISHKILYFCTIF